MKSLMYHYVRESNNDYPLSKHKDLKDFSLEISHIKKKHSFLNATEAINQTEFNPSNNIVILTFDDGLKDHLNVAEILKGLDINATFYIPIKPYLNNDLLHVHKAHLITSKFGEESILLLKEAIKKLNLDENLIENNKEKDFFKSRYKEHHDENGIKEFKKMINYYGSIGLRDSILNQILKSKNIKSEVESFYLTKKEIKYISSLGFEIGSHGVSHNVMSRLNIQEQSYELNSSKVYLENIIKKNITSFCYPYGRKSSYNKDTIKLLSKSQYKNAISVEYRDIKLEDIKNNIFEIPRYDCNQIKQIFNTQTTESPK